MSDLDPGICSPQVLPNRDRPRYDRCEYANVALLCDFREEGWASMDLVAEMFCRSLPSVAPVRVAALRPEYRRLGLVGRAKPGRNLERLMNRFVVYPRFLRTALGGYDLFHVIDHSYAHLALRLPPDQTIVHCHDLDAFRCLIEPDRERRPAWFRYMARTILAGLRRSRHVVCVSDQTRAELLRHQLTHPDRTSVIRNGVNPEFFETGDPREQLPPILGPHSAQPYILNVGSTISRKRIELLLEIFRSARSALPGLRLVRVGGDFTPPQRDLALRLGVADHVTTLGRISGVALAALYRGAIAAVQPSASEGFGLPVAEAMASGCPVVASDIPITREIAGKAARLVDGVDPKVWVSAIEEVSRPPARGWFVDAGRERTRALTWESSARQLADLYASCIADRRAKP